jgi:hypothetical protein
MPAFTTLALVSLLAFQFPLADRDAAEGERLFREAGVPTDPGGLTAWVRNLRLSAEVRAKAEALIRQLGSDEFEIREKASAALLELGPVVLPLLRKVEDSSDVEVRMRATEVARLVRRKLPAEPVIAATVRRLEAVDSAEAALALLGLYAAVSEAVPRPIAPLSFLTEYPPSLADQVETALARLLRHAEKGKEAIRAALGDKLPERRCAAATALLLAGLEEALPAIRELLKDPNPAVRLGVARVLAKRKDKSALPVLIALVGEAGECSALAEEILSLLAGDEPPALAEGSTPEAARKRREAWQAWWTKNEGRAEVFDRLFSGGVERFTVAATDVTRGYRSFVYEATVPGCKAEVRDGRLILHGDHAEGDQRLAITAQKLMGKARWPDALDITAKLGGSARENIAWHVGVSIGRVKVLFHPNHQGGAFRAEAVDTHEYIFDNQALGFTPAADALHEMTIRVRRTDRGYRLDVTLTEAKTGGRFQKTFEVTREQMGRYDRVGLERSGRTGGDALFGSLSIKPGR